MKIAALALVALLALAGCGGGDEDTPEPSEQPSATTTEAPTAAPSSDPSADIEAAVRAYSTAFLSGDGASAYALLSTRCQERTPLSEFAGIVEQAGEQFGPQDIQSVNVTVNGEQAQVTYTYADSSLDQTDEPWVNQTGWKNDDC